MSESNIDKFLSNLGVFLLIVLGILLYLVGTQQIDTLNVLKDVFYVYAKLGLLPFILILLLLKLLPKKTRK